MHYEAACNVWFTASGKAMPLMIKYKNSTKEIKCIRDIAVLKDEKQIYAGIKSHEYMCRGTVDDEEKYFKLTFYQDRVVWVIETIS